MTETEIKQIIETYRKECNQLLAGDNLRAWQKDELLGEIKACDEILRRIGKRDA